MSLARCERPGAGWIAESRDDVPESEESAVDTDAFFDSLALGSGTFQLEEKVRVVSVNVGQIPADAVFTHPFTSSQIYKVEF